MSFAIRAVPAGETIPSLQDAPPAISKAAVTTTDGAVTTIAADGPAPAAPAHATENVCQVVFDQPVLPSPKSALEAHIRGLVGKSFEVDGHVFTVSVRYDRETDIYGDGPSYVFEAPDASASLDALTIQADSAENPLCSWGVQVMNKEVMAALKAHFADKPAPKDNVYGPLHYKDHNNIRHEPARNDNVLKAE
jgi:hypothetical protein